MDTANDYANYRQPYIINESLANKIGWTPEQSLGKIIDKGSPGPIVGVVKDFNFSSLREPIGPMVLFLGRDYSRSFMVRINGRDMRSTLGRLEMMWKQRIPDRPFTYHFLDEDYNKLYVGEQRSSTLFTVAATLAILLACLGLFGLAAFTTVQRTKEIGIRRGARCKYYKHHNVDSKKFFNDDRHCYSYCYSISMVCRKSMAAGFCV
jgi:putative ABC transport system permease protein